MMLTLSPRYLTNPMGRIMTSRIRLTSSHFYSRIKFLLETVCHTARLWGHYDVPADKKASLTKPRKGLYGPFFFSKIISIYYLTNQIHSVINRGTWNSIMRLCPISPLNETLMDEISTRGTLICNTMFYKRFWVFSDSYLL